MEPVTMALILAGLRGLHHLLSRSDSTPAPSPDPPDPVITLVGSTGVGKSSVGNALLGYEAFTVDSDHHTTRALEAIPYRDNYVLQDTPGLRDTTDYSSSLWPAIENSELVIYVATGQLLRPELEFFQQIEHRQRDWDRRDGLNDRRKLALFLNKEDLRDLSMTSKDRQRQLEEIAQQVNSLIPAERIISGAANPFAPQGPPVPPQVNTLSEMIARVIAQG